MTRVFAPRGIAKLHFFFGGYGVMFVPGRCFVCLVVFLSSTLIAAAQSLVKNGSFENPALSDPYAAYDMIPAWQVPGKYIEFQKAGLYGPNSYPRDGNQWAELDAPSLVPQIVQTFSTESGAAYKVSFSYSGRPGYGAQQLGIYWNGELRQSVSSDGTSLSAPIWKQFSYVFHANSASSTLGFGSLASGASTQEAGGNLLDHVVVARITSANFVAFTPTPTSTATPVATNTPTATPSITPTATATPTPTTTPNAEIFKVCKFTDKTLTASEEVFVTKSELEALDANTFTLGVCKTDCSGALGGAAIFDSCGVCGGNNSTCADCAGVPNGTALVDCCGVCGGDGTSCPEKCTFYDLKTLKKQYLRQLDTLGKTVTKYSNLQRSCRRKDKSASRRIVSSTKLFKESKSILTTLIGDKIKFCDTEFCAKSSNQTAITALKRNSSSLYKYSREAQHASMKVCPKKRRKKNADGFKSRKAYLYSVLSLGSVPATQCLN